MPTTCPHIWHSAGAGLCKEVSSSRKRYSINVPLITVCCWQCQWEDLHLSTHSRASPSITNESKSVRKMGGRRVQWGGEGENEESGDEGGRWGYWVGKERNGQCQLHQHPISLSGPNPIVQVHSAVTGLSRPSHTVEAYPREGNKCSLAREDHLDELRIHTTTIGGSCHHFGTTASMGSSG